MKRADALIDICRFFLDHQHHQRGGRHRPHVNVIIDLETLEHRGQGQLLDGTVLPAGDIGRLLCDANLHRVLVTNRSTILDYGTTVHTVPAPLFNAVVVRDRHCRWPGCDRPANWCDAHHLRHWAHGGSTSITNLVLLCRRHHHRLHHPGWHAKLITTPTDTPTPATHPSADRPEVRSVSTWMIGSRLSCRIAISASS